MNGGKVICDNLHFLDSNNDKIKDPGEFDGIVVFSGGELLVKQSNMSKTDIQDYINGGWIETSGSYFIKTINVDGTDYTSLASPQGTMLIVE